MIDPYLEISAVVETVLTSTYAAEQFPVFHDRLHESVGHDGTRIGISPEDQLPQSGNMLVLDTDLLVQFYGKWKKEVNPDQKVDPRKVTMFAARLREAFRNHAFSANDGIWFFDILSVSYPEDPTGNKTRFEMSLRAKSYNSGIVETS